MRIAGLVLVGLLGSSAAARTSGEYVSAWNAFKATFGRTYSASAEAERFRCFRANLDKVDNFNQLGTSASYGINKFADMCADEFKAQFHNLQLPANRTTSGWKGVQVASPEAAAKAAADGIDWREKGAVTGVKDQGQCGSCWAFSAVGNMEGQWFLAKKELVSLSEEELVQCANVGTNQGCQGGFMDDAFDWVKSNGGINSEQGYPYTSGSGITGTCNTAKSKVSVAQFTGGHVDVQQDEDQMAAWVQANGPLSVAVDAGTDWQLYFGGIKTLCSGTQLDHGVLIVGYGQSTSGTAFWIVKNSWGASWGEKGYIRLHRGVNCNGIKQAPSSVKI